MRGVSIRHAWVGAAVAVAALVVGAGVASAGGGATLGLQVVPSSLIAGGPGFVFATFTNTGNSTLTHVIVNVDLGGASFNATGSPPACTAAGSGASCSLGDVKKGGVVVSTIAFTAPGSGGPLTMNGKATWDAASVGNPQGAAASKDTATAASQTASVFDLGQALIGVQGSCVSSSGSVTSGDIVVGISGNTSGLPCAPIVAGTTQLHDNCEVLFAKVPNGQTSTAKLTFPDDCLPWPANQHGDSPGGADLVAGTTLFENPVFPNTGPEVIVPACMSNGSIPPSASGYSTDACVVSVTSTDTEDSDADEGFIMLNVVGGPGDGAFHGG